ncbi:GntR family transcriptional regulator [Ruixingdingia sedimenti]|uniref:GntR family transcriptional regulator n=1 Tax=Ruixingdingia sedimenti TaxID=3073604 RepID=A0ABU1FDU1_9RHOB|nr:GntR family transcriptional regulator [Xinfangfangia sp. LG-4]MDR5655047.1 GntR family transcriptional regulator [Xinfangfangia sp. LG-4]
MTDSSEEIPQGQVVYRRLLEEIRDARLLPGTRLREVEVAERLGHSRTPVREAIRLLESDGLVVHQPRQGATVRVLDYPEVMELYEMRAVLEGTAARLAARVANETELRQLHELNAEFAAAGDNQQAARLNRQFHAMLLEAARNRFLLRSMRVVQKTMLILGPTTLLEADRTVTAAREHQTVLDALSARDGPGAEAAMRAHMEAAQMVRLRTLRRHERPLEE